MISVKAEQSFLVSPTPDEVRRPHQAAPWCKVHSSPPVIASQNNINLNQSGHKRYITPRKLVALARVNWPAHVWKQRLVTLMTRGPVAPPDRALLSPKKVPLPLSPSWSIQSTADHLSPRSPRSPRNQRVEEAVEDEVELPELSHSPRLRHTDQPEQLESADDEHGDAEDEDEDTIREQCITAAETVTSKDDSNTKGTVAAPGEVYEQTGKYSTTSSSIKGDGLWPRLQRMWIGHVAIRVAGSERRNHLGVAYFYLCAAINEKKKKQTKLADGRQITALERTFLSYLRTSLALSMIGVLIAQLLRLESPSAPDPNRAIGGVALAAAFICGSIVTVLTGAIRFWRQQVAMAGGKCWAGGPELLFIWGAFFALTVAMFVIMLVQPSED